MAIPDPVRELAVYPFRVLRKPPDVERVQFDGAWASFNPWPSAQMVFLEGDGPSDVAAVVEAIREAARVRGKNALAWWGPPESEALAPALEACGLVNEDTPGFEAIENPMALVHEPAAEIAPDLEIRVAGRAVGSSFAAFGDAGVNLFGGSVRAEARGRVVYRSLVRARWDYAVERGTPALTVQAGRMSLPILERLGFELITQVRVFVDNL